MTDISGIEKENSSAKQRTRLTEELINLAQVALSVTSDRKMTGLIIRGLCALSRETSQESESMKALTDDIIQARNTCGFSCLFHSREISGFSMREIMEAPGDARSLRLMMLSALRGLAEVAMEAPSQKARDSGANDFFYRGLQALAGNMPDRMLMDLLDELGRIYLGLLELIEEAGDASPEDINGGHGNIMDMEERIMGALTSGSAKHVFVPIGLVRNRDEKGISTCAISNLPPEALILATGKDGNFYFGVAGESFAGPIDPGAAAEILPVMRLMAGMSGALNRPLKGIPATVILLLCDSSMAALFSLLHAGIGNIRLSAEFAVLISPGVMKLMQERYGIELVPD